jgi:hypothetical protein
MQYSYIYHLYLIKKLLFQIKININVPSFMFISDLLRHQSQDIFLPISQIVRKNFIKMSLIIKE